MDSEKRRKAIRIWGWGVAPAVIIISSGANRMPVEGARQAIAQPTPVTSPAPEPSPLSDKEVRKFEGGSRSLVARTVGHAEGTRTASGGKTKYFHSHLDPGNGVRNVGTFSCQLNQSFCRGGVEAADRNQLKRLQRQYSQLMAQARSLGLEMTLEEKLNGIDLINQSPRAGLDQIGGKGAYAYWLNHFKARGLKGQALILEARVHSYRKGTGAFSAPGLRRVGVRNDQRRRMVAIAAALRSYTKQYRDKQISYSTEHEEGASLIEMYSQINFGEK